MPLKRIFISLLAVLILANCQSEKSADKQKLQQRKPSLEVADSEKTLDVPWVAVFNDSTQLLEIKRNQAANPANLNEQDIIDALNLKYPEIKIEAISREGNTAVVEIKDAIHLTEEMGSTGARAFLAEATFSLTEIDGIEGVDFRFEAGNHATPGLLTRASFENFN
jgi:hypothetical protein